MENVAMEDILADSEPKQRFLVGSLVEVRMLDKGLRGSWHPAKVLEVHKGKRRVEYEELLEDDEKTKLKEFIAVGRASDGDNLMGTLPLKSPPKKSKPLLRPRPPAQTDSQPISWTEGVWVDCYYDDAWWEGVLAENITVVNVDDVSMVTRRSEVDVLFPEENDLSKVSVNRMRIGQEWDEDTGNWSLKGCVPVPVSRPNKKRSNKKDSGSEKEVAAPVLLKATEAAMASLSPESKATHAAIESELCDSPTPLNNLIRDLCQNVESVVVDVIAGRKNAGHGHEETLNMTMQDGESSEMPLSLNVGALEPVDGPQAVEVPVEKEVEGNTTAEALNAGKVDVHVQTPVDKSDSAAKNEEAVQTVLTHAGWKITRSVRRKTGEVSWNCKTPKAAGSAVKTFTSLLEALSYEAQRGASGGKVREARILSQSSLADMKDSVDGAPGATATGEAEDGNDEFAVAARKILVNAGWEVFAGLRTGSDGQSAWVYRTPGTGSQPRKWFKNWRLALDEYVKQETDVPNQKKRGGRRESSSPVPAKRVTRRLSSSEAKKSVDASGPSFIKAEEVPKSMLQNFSSGFGSDLDDDDKREVDIVMDSGRKRTAVDLSQRFTRSSNCSLTGSSDLEKPFGSIVSFTEKDDAYTLQVTTHNFLREQISVVVEKGEMIIKARYGVEERFNNIPVRYHGSSSSRMPLPEDVERQKITAKLESFLLTCTLPKRVTNPNDWLEVKIS